MTPIITHDDTGVVEYVHPHLPAPNPTYGWTTCGNCHRTWADAVVTGWTPVPSARCPFEYDHEDDDGETNA